MNQQQPWNRRPTETTKAHAALLAYAELGPERSLAKLSQQTGRHKTLYEVWSRRHDWQVRVAAWDAHADEERFRAFQREQIQMVERHARGAAVMHGRVLQALQNIDVAELSKDPRTMAYMMDIAVKVERLTRGLPSERIELVNNLLTPIIQQLIAVFVEVNEIEDKDTRAAAFGERADVVVESVVSRFIPAGGI